MSAVHTSAQAVNQAAHQASEPDLFADDATQPLRLEFTGTLRADAQVRIKPIGTDGHALPVLCLELEGVGPGHHLLRAEQIFPEGHHAQAEKAARTLRKGMQVRVQTSALDLRLYLPHVERITIDSAPTNHHH